MSNKFLTRLLAVVMSVSLVIQPVTAFATEPAEGEINDPVLEEVQTFTLGADAAQLMEVQNEDPKPEPIPEPVPAKPLPALQNVKLEGDILSWDLDENSDMYIVQVGDNGDIFDQPSVNLADFCANFNYSSGTYPVTIEGNDLDMNSTTQKYETTYTYAPNITPPENKVIKTVSVNTPYASGIQEGQYVYSYSLASFDVPEVDLYFVDWYKIGDDGSLNAFRESVFTPGTYTFKISINVNYMYRETHVLADDCQLVIDGVRCDYDYKQTVSGIDKYYFYSRYYEIKGRPEIENLHIEGDYLYWDPLEGAASYKLMIGAHEYYLKDSDMPYNLKDAFKNTELISGEYTILFRALDKNADWYSNAYELQYVYNNRTLINSILISTNVKELLKDGNRREKATITNDGHPEVIVNFYNWRKVSEDGTEDNFYDKFFTPGKYRIEFAVFVGDSYKADYEIDGNTQLIVDGEPVKSDLHSDQYGRDIYYFYSPYYEVKSASETPIEKTKIEKIEATSNLDDIVKYGAPVMEPTFTFAEDQGVVLEGQWYKKEVDGNQIMKATDDTFTKGYWYYQITARIDDEYKDLYEFDQYVTLSVDGEKYNKIDVDTYRAPGFTVYDADARVLLNEVYATSNIPEIFVKGGTYITPTITENSGKFYFSFMYTNKIIGEKVAYIGTGQELTEGKYVLYAIMSLKNQYVLDNMISEGTVVYVDGIEWTMTSPGTTVEDGMIMGTFKSSIINIKGDDPNDPEEPDPPVPPLGEWVTKYGNTYYYYPNGEMATGLQIINGVICLFSKNGVLQTSVFYEDDGETYYFDKDGAMVKGFMTRYGATYYFDDTGVMQTGFVDIDDATYYFKADGRMTKSTWITFEGNRYYTKANGKLAKSETILKWGKKYTFDEKGLLIQ